jgi:hypothetical protein
MSNNTDKFNPGGTGSSSTVTSSVLPGSVNLIGPGGKIIKNANVNANNQIRFTQVVDCCDAGQVPFTVKFTGDSRNAGGASATAVLNVPNAAGNATQNNAGTVNKIIAGPGIYLNNNGEGQVTISLEPIRPIQLNYENFTRVIWSASDLKKGNPSDQSAFIAFGYATNTGNVISNGQGFIVRSRDGDNWIDLNNNIGMESNNAGVAIQSADLPGSGLVYFASDTNSALTKQSIKWGVEGRTDSAGCGWCSDGLDQTGPEIKSNNASRAGRHNGFTQVFYSTGSILTDALYLDFGYTNAASTSTDIYLYQNSPSSFLTTASVSTAVTVETSFCRQTNFTKAATDISPGTTSNYKICVVGYENTATTRGVLYRSTRNSNYINTWTTAITTSSAIRGIAYGNGLWVAVGDNDRVYISTNGVNWQVKSTGWPGANWHDVEYGNGYFMAVGEGGHITYTDDYTRTWQRSQSGTTSTLRSIAFSPKLCAFATVGDKRALSTVQLCDPPANSSLPTVTSNIGLSFGAGCITSWTTATNIRGGSTSTGGASGGTWKFTYTPYGRNPATQGYVNTATTATSEPSLLIQSPWSVVQGDWDDGAGGHGTPTSGSNMQFKVLTTNGQLFTQYDGYTLADPAHELQWEINLPGGYIYYSTYNYGGANNQVVGILAPKGNYGSGNPASPGSVEWAEGSMINGNGDGNKTITFTQGSPYLITLKLNEVVNGAAKTAGNVVATLESHQLQITWI